MSLYVDSSALLKRYVDEPDSDEAEALLRSDSTLLTARHAIVELDRVTCDAAADIAEITGVRTVDALHLAAARRAGGSGVPFLTYDVRQAQAARGLGFTVVGT